MKWYREGELHCLEQPVLYQSYKGVTAKVAKQEGETRTSLCIRKLANIQIYTALYYRRL